MKARATFQLHRRLQSQRRCPQEKDFSLGVVSWVWEQVQIPYLPWIMVSRQLFYSSPSFS